MADKPEGRIAITDFPGLISAADADDIPPGAADTQVNAGITLDAQLSVRSGYREVSFDAT